MNRTELTLSQIGREWRLQPRGDAFTQALLSFFRSFSGHTLQSYSFSILELFGWLWRRDRRVPTPDRITRGDAAEFANWLRSREHGLTKWWLEHDPERRFDLQIYEVVARNPGINIEGISRALGAYTPNIRSRLAKRLACLVKRRTLSRTPTVAEYRRQHGDQVIRPPEEVFKYTIATVATPAGAERASTAMVRLSALSSLWMFMIQSGENVPGATEPLLKHNIWTAPLKQAQAQAPSHQRAARQAKRTTLDLFFQLLATTYKRTHGERAAVAARAAFMGETVPRALLPPSYKDVRDRALLLFMAQAGVRSHEIKTLRRGAVVGDPPIVTIIGKRGKKRSIQVPAPALSALRELSAKLRLMARQQARHGQSGRAERLLSPNAPLFPAVAYWGANSGQSEGGLTRPGIAMMLRRRAESAGIDPESPLFQRVHPHGLRALFITHALNTGTPIHRVKEIVGHASIATTGRYAEERAPELLVADVFRPPAARPVAPPVARPERLTAETWQPERQPIRPAAPPRPRPPAPRPPPRPVRRPAPELVKRRELEREFEQIAPIREQPPPVREQMPPIAPPSPAEARESLGALVESVARWRGKPITEREEQTLQKCLGIGDEALRNLCVIYDIHWGESKNRQVLVSTGGGRASALRRARRGGVFEPNVYEEFEEEEFEEEDEFEEGIPAFDPQAALAEVDTLGMQRIAEIARAGQADLFAEAGTDKLNRIYSGKDSGLSWWTGTQGNLKPEMPVMSPDQIGMCTPAEQEAICAELVKLWKRWFDESPTKAESLVRWLGEALDTAAQMEGEVRRRDAVWVPPLAPWLETRFQGTRRAPQPRMVFRQHLDEEVVAWFKARAGQYRVSSGDPTTWRKKTAKPKVIGDMAPEWFFDDDPIEALGESERSELLDWLMALTDQPLRDRAGRFAAESGVFKASRVDVGEFVRALCMFDRQIDVLRDTRKREQRDFGRSATPGPFWRYLTVDEFPVSVRRDFQTLQSEARQAVLRGTGGRVTDFDAFNAIKRRVKGREEEGESKSRHRAPWYLSLVRKYFGRQAAQDEAIKLIARCGNVPLAEFRELFRVRGNTIEHDPSYKRAFAETFRVHSECVARRIARQMWEIKQGRATPKEAVTKPQHMVTLVEVMRTFKVPCTERQEQELRRLVPFSDQPEGVYQHWAKVRTAAGAERDELSEAELQERELTEQFEEQIMGQLRAEQFGEFEPNPRRARMPTPVHLMMALL